MSVPERIADLVTSRTKTVLVVLLVLTALVGAGATMVDDDSSLDQFESDSPEGEAQAYINENFTSEEAANTTSVQLIYTTDSDAVDGGDASSVDASSENALSRESLLASLEFQQQLRDNESINETLADENPIVGVENLVAYTAIADERVAELEQRGSELENRSAELNATSERLSAGIDDVRESQRAYEELNATAEPGTPEYEAQAEAYEAQIDETVSEATAGLDEEQTAAYEDAVENARSIESQLVALEAEYGEQAQEQEAYSELTAQMEEVYTAATMGVLEDEYAALESESEQLEEEQAALEESGQDSERPSLEEQIEALEGLDDEEFENAVERTLSDDASGGDTALGLMPSSYEPGSTEADARMTLITQSGSDGGSGGTGMGAVSDRIVESQLDLRELATDYDDGLAGGYIVFGGGILTDEIDGSMADSLAIVGPLALLFVVAALAVAYRDPIDIVLGVVGIGAVLLWTFGFMGWAGIAFNQMFVAVPVLLIGLSIDYAIHVFMRHREQRGVEGESTAESGAEATGGRQEPDDVRGSMRIALAGVGIALVWVTATTAIGFLANLVSPIGPIQEFGIVSSVGIIAALIVFGGLIPAAKIEIDSFLEARGYDRRKRAFGTGEGRFSDVLAVGSTAARKAPLILIVAVLLLTAGGVYGATQVDTSFNQEDFLAESPPGWTENLPGPMSPGEYRATDDLDYVNENFQRADSQAEILTHGAVADNETLERIAEAEAEAAESDVAYTLANGEAEVQSPLSVMEETAAQNESFNESYAAADTNGDDVPDENVSALYDELFEVNEEGATQVIHRTDGGEYESVRMVVAVDGDAGFDETTEEMRAIAAGIGDSGGGGEQFVTEPDGRWSAIATGDPIVSYVVEQDLLETVLQSLAITLVSVFVFLSVAYRLTGNSATLGAVTLLPVAFSVSWILGTMYLIGMPFNVLTGMITSLTIGLGVAYSIHVSARYTLELERQGNVWHAMYTTVTGTGGALLGSAATTVGGFGTLAFAILPVLRQFGIITALTITYAFLASVVVLPTLLVLWTRYFGPDVSFDPSSRPASATAASDGGRPEPQSEEAESADSDGDER
ncbi:efflux RND transporter permease subunit [Halostagnicola kamekurae]|uniref:Predicted exporter protein, RND superfamily n=1 Tax=Halostagnicola kamekurae TaxID=619731 RepID=A0A1I6SRN8_9EURY|nr:MMPL family transporter [Halostagnicola kamekurae]SFS79615.1 Predicted exporter protein, RND superfamily [Halostagnicola kamekurae]